MAATRKPPRLALVAPSGCLPDTAIADRAAQFFSRLGWQVQAGDTCFARETRFAGPDSLRIQELQHACTDRNLDIVLSARGGYGLSRLLAHLDFDAIRAADRIIVGHSDFTAFNLAYLARAGGISFQGPSAGDFAVPAPDAFTVGNFVAALTMPEHRVEFIGEGPDCIAKGTLWGGNLAMVCALVGTPFLPRVRDGILFLEDVNEPAYRIERMLYQLLQAGVLGRQRAIVLGEFTPIPVQTTDHGFGMAQVVAQLRGELQVPVLTGLPFGHVPRKLTLPVGAKAQLTMRGGEAQLQFHGHPILPAGRRP